MLGCPPEYPVWTRWRCEPGRRLSEVHDQCRVRPLAALFAAKPTRWCSVETLTRPGITAPCLKAKLATRHRPNSALCDRHRAWQRFQRSADFVAIRTFGTTEPSRRAGSAGDSHRSAVRAEVRPAAYGPGEAAVAGTWGGIKAMRLRGLRDRPGAFR